MRHFLAAACAVLLALCLLAPGAHASVVIGGTRVVFPASQGEVTVRLSNSAAHPALVEAWIDDGDVQSTPDTANTPFLITPPLFRMEANGSVVVVNRQGWSGDQRLATGGRSG